MTQSHGSATPSCDFTSRRAGDGGARGRRVRTVPHGGVKERSLSPPSPPSTASARLSPRACPVYVQVLCPHAEAATQPPVPTSSQAHLHLRRPLHASPTRSRSSQPLIRHHRRIAISVEVVWERKTATQAVCTPSFLAVPRRVARLFRAGARAQTLARSAEERAEGSNAAGLPAKSLVRCGQGSRRTRHPRQADTRARSALCCLPACLSRFWPTSRSFFACAQPPQCLRPTLPVPSALAFRLFLLLHILFSPRHGQASSLRGRPRLNRSPPYRNRIRRLSLRHSSCNHRESTATPLLFCAGIIYLPIQTSRE